MAHAADWYTLGTWCLFSVFSIATLAIVMLDIRWTRREAQLLGPRRALDFTPTEEPIEGRAGGLQA